MVPKLRTVGNWEYSDLRHQSSRVTLCGVGSYGRDPLPRIARGIIPDLAEFARHLKALWQDVLLNAAATVASRLDRQFCKMERSLPGWPA